MTAEPSKPLIDFSHASGEPISLTSQVEASEGQDLPDDHLPKSQESDFNPEDEAKTVGDNQIITANIHAG